MVTLRQRLGAAVAIAAVAVVGLPGLAAAAPADAAPSNIDPSARGQLTVTAQGRTAEGVESAPIEGVELTLQRVTEYGGQRVDLATPQGWRAIEGADAATIEQSGAVMEPAGVRTTGASGEATFEDLDLGLYYVTPTAGPAHVAARTMPFLVTIPYPDEKVTGGWLYDVAVFPKSSIATADKTVDASAALAVGDRATWTLTGSVPEGATAGQPLSRYVVTDTLDPRLQYVPDSLRITTQPDAGLGAGDYAVSYEARVLTITLTPSGLTKLAQQASPAATLIASFDTTVVAIGDGTIENAAAFAIGEARFAPRSVMSWGSLEIYKHVAGDVDAPLAGAVFQAYTNADDAKNREHAVEMLVGGQLVSEFTTGSDGTVLLPGFPAGTTVHLVETTAPAGYTASGSIDPVTIVTGENRVEIANAQRSGVDLPVLGAAGMAGAALLGLGLIGAGVGIAVVSKRRTVRAQR
ncbi:SpaH/EbpB family LPXTG-anchored major pilin [Georgenia satyanarayanai]|uniref:SpaH/EbpB family LPXTG-anchored major pilin n=1 Tax=Georgenia satyanarayanai TaxID=860221 RepID=UPI0020420C5A|nr:SpaH/EbpB family LPXTG-anchored major pilin [Georgenia satyanarayanai]MCM3659799.1 SpaH/EbpB family LPXTG-anchored major pilin [Georgenia satyanarayanai]